ncbi:tetratricopeptide repeat-containing sensor histidine kinase [Marinifilum sp. D714]|uniref:tetratricopeptide repeat-containing sensor histidine kinase n=1 Tax=Marinifilum sp. D714 TaxID=2937523 RepID=UPI0027CA85D3|nr:tetratricopeptide repeat-containing sensor histidine kinase [Marinifilum sp. D714]MDQ2180632.1 tetratricopeptide repeat-containing sensor histidine kinase [Marinifilum sp. D714]
MSALHRFTILFSVLLSFAFVNLHAQNQIQEAEELLPKAEGEKRIALLRELSKLYLDVNIDKSIDYLKEVVVLSSDTPANHATALYDLGNLYRKVNNFRRALDCHLQALEIRKNTSDVLAVSASYNNIGEIHKILNKHQKALEYFNQSLKIRQKEGSEKEVAYTLNNIGSVYWLDKDYANALEYYLKSLEIRSKLGDKSDISSSLNNLGNVYKNLNKYNKALDYYKKALTLREELGDKSLIAYTLNDIGGIYWRLNNFNESLNFYNRALKIRREIGNKRYTAATLKNIGTVYKDLNELDFSLKHYNESLKIYNETGDLKAQANVYSLIGNLYSSYNNFDKSQEYHKIALNLHEKLGNAKGIAYSSNNIGEILMDYYKSDDALQYLESAYENANYSKDRNLQKVTSENLFEYYSNKGNYKKALEYYRNYSNTQYDSIVDQYDKDRISEFEAKYEISKNKEEIKGLKEYNRMQAILIYLFIVLIIFAGIIGYITNKNIKLRKETTAALTEKNRELEEINSRLKESDIILRDLNLTKDKIFNIISTDLRDPFIDLKNISTKLIESFDENDIEYQKSLAIGIRDLSAHTNELVENILLWSASQAGKTTFSPKYFNIRESINGILQKLSGPIIEKNLKFIFNMDNTSMVYADSAAISEVFKNLISNAIKFSYSEGKITLSAREKKYLVEIEISDEGVGMSKSNLNKIFRLDNNYLALGTAQEKGAGIGLLLCKEYVEKNGGKIWAESEEGKGSSFYITIPKSEKILESMPKSNA